MYRHKLRLSGWLAGITLTIGLLVAAPSQADPLDTVLDILYKAGVIDGNVKAAKPLISCLADGKNVADCTAGAADQSEFAADPQVKNVIDIYQAFRAKDYYTVLKKAGITVGCALIPGGEVKDVLCGELGKIAAAVLDGVGSVLGAVGSFIVSIFGGGSDPPPMPPENYYTLNFMPWYHWSVVYQLDNDTPSNNQILNAPMAACVDYFYHHTYSKDDANKVCASFRARMNKSGYDIGNSFRDETESYFQLHFAPKVEEWAEISFNNNDNINIYAKQAMNTCLWDERQHIPLPSPGLEQCQAMQQSAANLPSIFQAQVAQMVAQCQALVKLRTVPADNDAYTRICTPMKNRVIGRVIFAMGDLKSRMETAAAAGCPNSGYPKSIHCDSFATHDACMNAMPEHASMCSLDYTKAIIAMATSAGCKSAGTLQTIECTTFMSHAACLKAMPDAYDSWCQFAENQAVDAMAAEIAEAESTDDAPCQRYGKRTIQCVHPMQILHCNSAKTALGDAWGLQAVAGISCEVIDTPEYDQLKQQADQVLTAINADYPAPGLHLQSLAQVRAAPPPAPCGLARHDPLVITCAEGFRMEAIPERASAVYTAINADNQGGRPRPIYCLADVDNDGAEAPCLEGAPIPELPPAVDLDHPVPVQPALRLRPTPVIKTDDGGGG